MLRGLRLVSQLGFHLSDEAIGQMRAEAGGLAHVSGERIGGGLAADGRGELSKLLLGRDPVTALRLGRDTGVLLAALPELAPTVGFDTGSPRQPLPLDEHVFAVVGAAADADAPLEVRLAALLHDVAKPSTDPAGDDHAAEGARITARALDRLRYPTAFRRRVCAIVAAHAFPTDPWDEPDDGGRATRRFLARHGAALAHDLVLHKRADLAAKRITGRERAALERLAAELESQAEAPHAIRDLAVSGDDLLAAGVPQGPAVGDVLRALLERVVDDPALNQREALLALAQEVRA
jgi:tRNA nucleotidyltransferase (CCA-adding enzyme)